MTLIEDNMYIEVEDNELNDFLGGLQHIQSEIEGYEKASFFIQKAQEMGLTVEERIKQVLNMPVRLENLANSREGKLPASTMFLEYGNRFNNNTMRNVIQHNLVSFARQQSIKEPYKTFVIQSIKDKFSMDDYIPDRYVLNLKTKEAIFKGKIEPCNDNIEYAVAQPVKNSSYNQPSTQVLDNLRNHNEQRSQESQVKKNNFFTVNLNELKVEKRDTQRFTGSKPPTKNS